MVSVIIKGPCIRPWAWFCRVSGMSYTSYRATHGRTRRKHGLMSKIHFLKLLSYFYNFSAKPTSHCNSLCRNCPARGRTKNPAAP